MSFRAAIRVVLGATLLLTVGCAGGQASPPRAALGPSANIAFEGEVLPVTRTPHDRVPPPGPQNPSLGAEDAPVIVQVWSDFECPFCAEMQPVLAEMLHVYAGKVRLVWHDYPLPFHAHARLAASAGREAFAQGGGSAFWNFHDAVYTASAPRLDELGLQRFAVKAGLDGVRFRDALSKSVHDIEIKRDIDSGEALGVSGTPAFLVNDLFFVGSLPFDVLRVIVDRALSDAGA